MNLDELIQALTELKESGKAVDKLPVEFRRHKKENKRIDRVRVYADSGNGTMRNYDRIELVSLS